MDATAQTISFYIPRSQARGSECPVMTRPSLFAAHSCPAAKPSAAHAPSRGRAPVNLWRNTLVRPILWTARSLSLSRLGLRGRVKDWSGAADGSEREGESIISSRHAYSAPRKRSIIFGPRLTAACAQGSDIFTRANRM